MTSGNEKTGTIELTPIVHRDAQGNVLRSRQTVTIEVIPDGANFGFSVRSVTKRPLGLIPQLPSG
jgi:hypothetical protein